MLQIYIKYKHNSFWKNQSYIKNVIAKENHVKEGLEDYKHVMCETIVPFFKLLFHCYSGKVFVFANLYCQVNFPEEFLIGVTKRIQVLRCLDRCSPLRGGISLNFLNQQICSIWVTAVC